MDSLTIIREFLDSRLEIAPETVLPEAKLDDLDVDSLMLAEIVFEFEDRFNLTLPGTSRVPVRSASWLR
jgi:acyl carrier protein